MPEAVELTKQVPLTKTQPEVSSMPLAKVEEELEPVIERYLAERELLKVEVALVIDRYVVVEFRLSDEVPM